MEKPLSLSGIVPSACLGRPSHRTLHAGSTSHMSFITPMTFLMMSFSFLSRSSSYKLAEVMQSVFVCSYV